MTNRILTDAEMDRMELIAAIHPVVLCKVQILAPPPDFERKLNGKN